MEQTADLNARPDRGETDDWTEPVIRTPHEQATRLAFMTVVAAVIAGYLLLAPASLGSIWVLLNVTVGYAVLQSPHRRRFYFRFFAAFGEARIWKLALLVLLGTWLSLALSFSASPTVSEEASDSGGNPFVSNLIFLLALLPIVPLFAFGETWLFQGLVAKLCFPGVYRYCPTCRILVAATPACPFCDPEAASGDEDADSEGAGGDVTGGWGAGWRERAHAGAGGPEAAEDRATRLPAPGVRWVAAVLLSGLVFGGAHALLIGSWLPLVLALPGAYLMHLFLKEGYLTVTKVHLLYDYIVLGLLLLAMTLGALLEVVG